MYLYKFSVRVYETYKRVKWQPFHEIKRRSIKALITVFLCVYFYSLGFLYTLSPVPMRKESCKRE